MQPSPPPPARFKSEMRLRAKPARTPLFMVQSPAVMERKAPPENRRIPIWNRTEQRKVCQVFEKKEGSETSIPILLCCACPVSDGRLCDACMTLGVFLFFYFVFIGFGIRLSNAEELDHISRNGTSGSLASGVSDLFAALAALVD